jgi:N-acetyl-anhydromuramyl-L-alanine amidase AmpD
MFNLKNTEIMSKSLKYRRNVQVIEFEINAMSRAEAIDKISKHFNEMPENHEFNLVVSGFCKSHHYLVDDKELFPAGEKSTTQTFEKAFQRTLLAVGYQLQNETPQS